MMEVISSSLSCFDYPRGLIVHTLVFSISFALFIYWSKKKALMSFRAWALLMTFLHIFYIGTTCATFRQAIDISMRDIFFIRGLEALATIITMLRLYFIIEAHGIDISSPKKLKNQDIEPLSRIAKSVSNAIKKPENPLKMRGISKKLARKPNCLKRKLIDLLF